MSSVKGIYLFRIPYVGYVTNFVQTKLGWFIAIIVPAALLVFWLAKDIVKEALRSDEKTSENKEGVMCIVQENSEHIKGNQS